MMMSILMLLALGLIMLGIVGRKSVENKKTRDNFNQQAMQDLNNNRNNLALANFEKSAVLGSDEAILFCGLMHLLGLVSQTNYNQAKQALFWFTKGMNRRDLTATLFVTLMLFKKQVNITVDDNKILDSLVYILCIFEKGGLNKTNPKINAHSLSHPIVEVLQSELKPFNGPCSYDKNIKHFYLQASLEQKEVYTYVHAMYLLGYITKEHVISDLEQGVLDKHTLHNAVLSLMRCEQFAYLDSSVYLARLFESAANTLTKLNLANLADLPPSYNPRQFGNLKSRLKNVTYAPCFDYAATQEVLNMGTEELWQQTFSHYEEGMRQGSQLACFELGEHYLYGRGCLVNRDKAIACYQAARSALASLRLGEIFNFGLADAKITPELALKYYQDCCALPNSYEVRSQAALYIANIYSQGLGSVQADLVSAFNWMCTAANLANPQAQFNLASMLQHGYGTQVDLAQAVEWYCSAASLGHHEALGALYELQQTYPELVRTMMQQNPDFMASFEDKN